MLNRAFAIPEMMATCECHHGVDERVSRFCIPIGTALNRAGSTAFIFIASCFLCNLNGHSLDSAELIFIGVLTAVSSLAIPAIPSGSIVTILIILSSVNIGVQKVGIILAVEWITDRLRATSNCMSIIFGTILTQKLCQDLLSNLDNPVDVEIDLAQNKVEPDHTNTGENRDYVV